MNWLKTVSKLKLEGRFPEVVEVLQCEMQRGNLAARVQLAMLGRHAGISDDDADRIIEDVEALMDDSDVETHWQLSRAYELMLGTIPHEEKSRRSFEHLLAAARLGNNAADALAVASFYHYGSTAVEANLEEAMRWYKEAASRGSEEAAPRLRELVNQRVKRCQ